ncbi:MAG: cytidylate kinase family protein [Candidatus Micrarchaeota archaeon]|nr:cytidylate kinase family protein [Candidatus Micrarchaeota archaeon]
MKIAISGLSGCGNTTACNNVGKALGLKTINYTLRNAADESGFTLTEVQKLALSNAEIDYALDAKLARLADSEDKCIVGTRLAGWLIDSDLSVWLHASLATRAGRIASRETRSLQEVMDETARRDQMNIDRFKNFYGVDTLKHDHFDLVVNTERLTQQQVAALIVAAAKLAKEGWGKVANPYPEAIKSIISRKLTSEKVNSIKDSRVKQVISCLQFK